MPTTAAAMNRGAASITRGNTANNGGSTARKSIRPGVLDVGVRESLAATRSQYRTWHRDRVGP
eukprot:3072138-Rhodomonas_salina.2